MRSIGRCSLAQVVLALNEPTARCLKLPLVIRPVPDAAGERVKPTEIEVPTILVRLVSVEYRRFDHERSVIDGRCRRPQLNVRRIECVMTRAEPSDRLPPRARCMNATGPSAGSPTGPPASVNPVGVVDGHSPDSCELHKQIVRMLSIDQRSTVELLRLPGRFPESLPYRPWAGSEANSPANVSRPMSRRAPCCHPHPPVRGD